MIRLLLLGSASLSGGRAGSVRVLSQPKRLGVLAYLALARPRGFHRRDTLLALFWPELDQRRARAALRQTLHFLRRELRPGVILGRGNEELALDPERLWCDAVAFDDAAARADLEEALALYRGDLLAGYHVTQASRAFEEWLESERRRLRRHAAEAARRLARAKEDRGDYRAAAEWARRALEHAPYDEAALQHRLTLLDRAGDRASACAEHEAFARRLRSELQVEPSPETEAIIAEIRTRRDPNQVGAPSVEGESDDGPTAAAARVPTDPSSRPALHEGTGTAGGVRGRFWRRSRSLSLLAVVPLAASLLWVAREGGAPEPAPGAEHPPSVAVLPFEQAGHAGDDQHLAAALTVELTAALAGVRDLVVVSPAFSPDRSEAAGSLAELGEKIGASHLLRGSIRSGDDRLRVVAELVHSSTGRIVWAEAFERERADLLAVQQELATGIAAALRPRLSPEERERVGQPPTVEPRAYDLYLGARELAARSVAANAAAIEMLREALELDPGFARAHAALSNAYLHRVQMGMGAQWADSGVAAARRALDLDEGLAEAYRELGANQTWQGRLEEAEDSFRRAVALKPSYGEASLGLGLALAWQGVLEEALQHYERAFRLLPGNSTTSLQIGVIFLGLERFDDAERWLRNSLDLRPGNPLTLQLLTLIDLARGDTLAARERVDLLLALDSTHYRAVNAAADVALFRGRADEARRYLARQQAAASHAYAGGAFLSPQLRLGYTLLELGETARGLAVLGEAEAAARAALERGDQRYGVPLEVAAIHAARGEDEAAVEWLDAAVRAGFRMPSFVEVLAPFAALRGHPDYERVLASVRESLREMTSSPSGLAALRALADLPVTLAASPVEER